MHDLCQSGASGRLEKRRDPRCIDMAESAAAYLMRELYWTTGSGAAGFSYPVPGARSEIHNANLLGAALLCRVSVHAGDQKLLDAALAVTRHTVSRQQSDGSWYYGEGANQRWIDNFHTGFNLRALRAIGRHAGTEEFAPSLRRGYAFYRDRFFREDGAPQYYHDRLYPIDVHAAAQSIITLVELEDIDEQGNELAGKVLRFALEHLWDEEGYFYYQVLPFYRNRIAYMRWSQAWMLLALASLLERSAHFDREMPERPSSRQGGPGDTMMKATDSLTYVVITPARNEAATIEGTIRSMAQQTRPPLVWVIVSDGWTDGTEEIVKRYLPQHVWMRLVSLPDRKERHFGGKVRAFNAGYAKVRGPVL